MGTRSAPAAGLTSRTREVAGHRPGGNTAPARGARWTESGAEGFRERGGEEAVPGRRGTGPSRNPAPAAGALPGERNAGRNAFLTSAARGLKIAGSGAPRGVRRVAQSLRAASWLNGSGPIPLRLAALRCPSSSLPRGSAGGRRRMRGNRGEAARMRGCVRRAWTAPPPPAKAAITGASGRPPWLMRPFSSRRRARSG